MAVTTTDTDDQLLARAIDGDQEALAAILERHLHPAWRIALAASVSPAAAEAAVVTGVCDALNAASRNPDPTVSLRTRIAACVHAAAAAADGDRTTPRPASPPDDPVLAAFASLPVASRTALWLTEVEGGEPAQVGPVLRVDRGVAAALATRAAATLRDRLAADAADRVDDPECARLLAKLPAHAAGKLWAEERTRLSEHLASCGSCAAALAAVVAPRPALRRLVVPVPATLPGAIAERWAEAGGRDRLIAGHRWSERTIGVAAAGVLVVGLCGAVLLGRGGGRPTVAEFASPTPIDLSSADDPGTTSTTVPLSTPNLPPPGPALSTGAGVASSGGSRSPGGGTGVAGDRPRGDEPAAPPSSTPTTAPPTTTTPTTTPTTGTTPTTQPPAGDDGSGGDNPIPSTDDSGTTIEVPGVVTATVGDPTSGDPLLEVEIAGLPPVTVPNLLP